MSFKSKYINFKLTILKFRNIRYHVFELLCMQKCLRNFIEHFHLSASPPPPPQIRALSLQERTKAMCHVVFVYHVKFTVQYELVRDHAELTGQCEGMVITVLLLDGVFSS
jgi:hypothetical protein